MSTHSRIGMINADGSVDSIYCHFDGHLHTVGKILLLYYRNRYKVKDLLALGNLSSISSDLFAVYAYARNFGEDLNPPRHDESIKELMEDTEEYTYVFNPVMEQWFFTVGEHEFNGSLPRLHYEDCRLGDHNNE